MRIVMKFGGTSVGDLDRIKNVARKVKKEVDKGYQVCVVLSAMSGVTNQLIEYVEQSSLNYDPAEYDTVVSSGEQVTSGLLAINLQELGIKARSWLGWQAGIISTTAHARARIDDIQGEEIIKFLNNGWVCVVAGFQAYIPETNRITTLGRGGSDTSAVALAVGVKADRCDIYTDVDGVYTCDPRVVPEAKKLDSISFEEMLELASLGSKVLQTRSVEIAMNYKMPLQVLSSFEDKPGTLIKDEDKDMEKQVVVGVTAHKDEAQIVLSRIDDKPGQVAKIFAPIADANINVDMIIQTTSGDLVTTDVTFTVPEKDMENAVNILSDLQEDIGYKELYKDKGVAKVSVVGIGMRSHTGVGQTVFETLAKKGINIRDISTSEVKISVLIHQDYVELAQRALHEAFELDK